MLLSGFLNMDGIGETQINSLSKFFSNQINLKIINELSKHLIIKKINKKIDGKLKNKSFLITGKLLGISRAEAKSIIDKNSGKIEILNEEVTTLKEKESIIRDNINNVSLEEEDSEDISEFFKDRGF